MAKKESQSINATPEVRTVALSTLKPAPYNPRVISTEALAGLRRSLELYGYADLVVANKRTGHVVGGHQRLQVLKDAGIKQAPVVFVDLDDKKERQLNVALNSPAISGDFTRDLEGMIEEFRFDLPEADFDAIRFDDLLDEIPPDEVKDVDEDVAPAVPEKAISKTGDLWEIGPHRLVVGDCRDGVAVRKALGDQPCELMVTDPPYCSGGFQEAGKAAGTWGEIAADNLSSRGYRALLVSAFSEAKPQTAYVFTDWRMWIPLFDLVESSGLAVRSMIVWDKGTPGLGSLWRPQHEILMFASRRANRRIKGIPGFGNIITCKRSGNKHHYTEKPVELLRTILEGDAPSGRAKVSVYDPFLGSGSMALAAHQLHRSCRGIEVEPRILDVAVLRLMRAAPDLEVKCSRPEAVKAMLDRREEVES